MKKILCFTLFVAGLSAALISCSSGDYVANSANPGNNSINPLNPLTSSQFTWPALGTFSATVNGSQWVADTSWYYLDDSTGANIVWAYKNYGKNNQTGFNLYLVSTYAVNIYNMGFKQYNTSGAYSVLDSPTIDVYSSILGNSGEVFMQQTDTAIFQGRFYFQGVDPKGNIENVTNGYFDLHK